MIVRASVHGANISQKISTILIMEEIMARFGRDNGEVFSNHIQLVLNISISHHVLSLFWLNFY